MTLYRNRDIREPKPVQTVVTSALLFSGLSAGAVIFFGSLIPDEIPPVLVGGGIFLMLICFNVIWLWMPAHFRRASRYLVDKYRRDQGRLTAKECEKAGLVLDGEGLPLASLEKKESQRRKQKLGKPSGRLEGHALIVGPTRSGKGMHLTELLYSSDYAMIVVDPKGEQYQRTAGYRAAHFGPVYTLPGNSLDLSTYYQLAHNDHLTELHFHLMKPWADSQTIFAEKTKFLFQAAGAYAQDHRLNPIQVLLDAANTAPAVSLGALASSDYDAIMNFTNGDEVDKLDKFAASSWGSFSTRMFDYQQHWHTLTQGNSFGSIPVDWAKQKGTIYITYPFDALKGVGGAVSATIAALMRYQKLNELKDPIICAVDELPAVGLRNVDEYLATVGGYNISMVLYVQTYAQLSKVYGERAAETILSNCLHQVWYPPADMITAKHMSEIYGTKLHPRASFNQMEREKRIIPDLGMKESGRGISLDYRPALAPEEMMALNKDEVIVQIDRQYVTRAYRLWPVPKFKSIEPPSGQIEGSPARPVPHWGQSGSEVVEAGSLREILDFDELE